MGRYVISSSVAWRDLCKKEPVDSGQGDRWKFGELAREWPSAWLGEEKVNFQTEWLIRCRRKGSADCSLNSVEFRLALLHFSQATSLNVYVGSSGKKRLRNEMSGFKEKNFFWQPGGVDSDGDILMWSERSWRKDGCMKTVRAHIRWWEKTLVPK